jgi:hypothetical protein
MNGLKELAEQAGIEEAYSLEHNQVLVRFKYGSLEAFAKLVAAKEREALTPRCWTAEMNDAWNKAIPDLTLAFDELIRARGEA